MGARKRALIKAKRGDRPPPEPLPDLAQLVAMCLAPSQTKGDDSPLPAYLKEIGVDGYFDAPTMRESLIVKYMEKILATSESYVRFFAENELPLPDPEAAYANSIKQYHRMDAALERRASQPEESDRRRADIVRTSREKREAAEAHEMQSARDKLTFLEALEAEHRAGMAGRQTIGFDWL
jgi:hypothetical protein